MTQTQMAHSAKCAIICWKRLYFDADLFLKRVMSYKLTLYNC